MDTIEHKVQQLKELSKKQKKLNEVKQDIADILGSADMEEKKKIAEKMAQTPYENMEHARNLQFIVPYIVKELYDHDGQKGEFIIPKKEATPVIETAPAVVEREEQAKISKISKIASKINVIPGLEIQKPKVKSEEVEQIEEVEANKERVKTLENLHKYLPLEFFAGKKSICYPGSSIDVSLAQVFGKNVIHMDQNKNDVEILQKNWYKAINDDINTHGKKYDLIFDSRSQVSAEAIDKLVHNEWYALVENAHAHGNYFYNSPEYELIANISTWEKTYKRVKENNPFSSGDINYYLFKKTPIKIKKITPELQVENIKLEALREQKKWEIKNTINIDTEKNKKKLTRQEEEEEIKKTFQGKSLEESTKIIQTDKDWKINKIIKKIWIAMGIITITSWLIRAIWTRAQKDAKNKRIYETEQGVDEKKIEEKKPEDKFTINKLQNSIQKERLHGITYENIMDAIQNISNTEIQKKIIILLKTGNVIWLQEFYGMKKNSEYTSNKATGNMDVNTLNKIRNPLFGLIGKYILNNTDIPNDIKEIYQKFIIGEISNNKLTYLILSKNTCTQYLFSKDHELVDKQTILIGGNIGNHTDFMPYQYYKLENGKKNYVRWEINKNTPTGLFKVKKIIENLSSWYKVDGPKRGINIVPINIQGDEEERFKYKQWGMAIHPIYEPPNNPEKYEKAIESNWIEDNSITHGCPNIQNFGIIFDQLALGSKVYICSE